MIDNIKKNINKIILIVFIALIFLMIIVNIFDNTPVVYEFNPIILILSTLIYIGLLVLIYKKLIPKISNNKILRYVLLAIIFVLCVSSAFVFQVNYKYDNGNITWDLGQIFEIARKKASNIPSAENDWYLNLFFNNTGIATLYTALFLIVLKINPNINLINVATLFNALVVYLTIVLTYLSGKKMFNEKKSLLLLFILMFTAPFYLYTSIYYSDTLSMLMTIVIFYIFLHVSEDKSKAKNIVLSILLGIATGIGYIIKSTSIFIFIAIAVYLILQKDTLKILKKLILSVIVCALVIVTDSKFIQPHFVTDKNVSMPLTHWVMMGLTGNGGYDEESYRLTNSYNTTEEKKQANIEEIKKKLKEYNVVTFSEHLEQKLHYAWADGTYFAPVKLARAPINRGILHEFVLQDGKYNQYFKYFPQAMHIGMFVLMIANAILIIKNKNYKAKDIIFVITILGMTMFLLMWENRSRYVLTILPIMILLEINGIDILEKIKFRKKE